MPSKVAEMLTNRGFVKDLSPEDRARMDSDINALVEEWFGAASTVAAEPKKKTSKTKPAVVTATPAVIDRAHLETLTVSALKELGKDCSALKGRKPRDKMIELLLEHLSAPSPVTSEVPVEPVADSSGSEAGSDDELREEVLPPVEPKKKEKEKKEKAPKEKKEKAPKEKKEKKEKKAPKAEESDDENTVELRAWYHPNELSKPIEERVKYFIDPKTNQLYHPDRLADGNAEWQWDEETLEITPVG